MAFDPAKYPKDWKQISQRIKDRDGWRCKWCGIAHNDVGFRRKDGSFERIGVYGSSEHFYAADEHEAGDGPKPIRIVLTVAHVHDPDPFNVSDDNLAALCQRCHLRHDGKLHAERAAETRLKRSGQLTFEDQTVCGT